LVAREHHKLGLSSTDLYKICTSGVPGSGLV
jgi:hypothetical protein